jgi:diguanylate cyclase (GGDEF)-like protein
VPWRHGVARRTHRGQSGVAMLSALLGNRFRSAADLGPQPAAAGPAAEIAAGLHSEATTAAYRGAPANLAATGLLGLAMALAIDPSAPAWHCTLWLILLLVATGVRMAHALRWRHAEAPEDLLAPMRQYTVGLVANASLWAGLPWLVFPSLDPAGRTVALLAAVGVASVEARSLAAIPAAAIGQAALVLLPCSLWMVESPERGELAVSALGAIVFAIIVAGILSRHRALRTSLSVAQEGRRQQLVEAEYRRQIERLLTESAESRAMMERAQLGLEQRIDERTATLEDRSRDLARQAVTDSLTRLPNRKGINEHLTELLAPMTRPDNQTELALLFLDLDDFKEVNDQHGHLAGDSVLSVVAERLRETLPRSGFAARWGGDEFIVVLPGMGRVDQVRLVAEQLRATLCVPIRLEEGVVRTGCSIGIALAPFHGRTPEALIIAADQAVYAAKSERSSRVRVFDVELAKRAGRHHQLAQALPAAMELGQLEVAYQPIVGSADGIASHVEALARWRHPKFGVVSPGEFIPVAEASGHIHTLGRWVLRQACIDAARWPGSHAPKVSVNVSALQVNSGRLVAQVREALAAAGLPAQRLLIELTESLPMARSDGVAQTLSDLRAMGVTLAIDDFGTGYSSLSSLMKQPLSLVKVDRSFVQDVPGEGELLIKATVDVARSFGLKVVAEGVETPAQRDRLGALGVDYMQGYLFGRPMPNAEFVAWLALRDGSAEPIALRA